MLKNYILTTLRGLRRDYSYAGINVIGLAVGIACFVILALFLESQLTYDRHFEGHENIYRVVDVLDNKERSDRMAITSRELAPLLKQDYPEVLDYVRFSVSSNTGRLILRNGDRKFYWEGVYLADPNVFEVFSHDIVVGDPKTALDDPLSIAISESLARSYFGDRNPIGETLSTDTAAYHVTLVYKDLPENTHLRYNALLSYNRLKAFLVNVDVTQALWGISDFTYVVMRPRYDPKDFSRISEDFFERYMKERGQQFESTMRFYLEPLADIHLNSLTQNDRPRGDKFYVYTFGVIALFVLLVACINYMNLATARSIQRAKEVGMRKVIGASKLQLIGQFLGESLIFATIAVVVAAVLVKIALVYTPVNALLDTTLEFDPIARPGLIVVLASLAGIVGILSGLYPAFYLSAIPPSAALRGQSKGGQTRGGRMRQALVFLQFAISIGVTACTLLMGIQLRYVASKDLGFDPENVVLITMIGADLIEKTPLIKGELGQDSRIVATSLSFNIPGIAIGTGLNMMEREDGTDVSQTVRVMGADEDYLDLMGIELVAGHRFDPAAPMRDVVYVNESLVKQMGWTDPIGKRIGSEEFPSRVVGVIKDFHYYSLHHPVEPMFLFYNYIDFSEVDALNRLIISNNLYVKIAPGDVDRTIDFLRRRFAEYDPLHPFEYRFLDDILTEAYASGTRQMELIGIFAAVCIFISCLGLFGLSAFTTAQRTKEIGIRKILGATTQSIILLLFRDIAGLIVLASVAASVIAYYVIANWLAGFAYREEINFLVFLAATGFAMAIAFATVALQSLRTATASPGDALRYEG